MIDEPWRIELFGGLTLRRSDRCIDRFSTRKAAALLARLALTQRPQTRDELVDLLWPDSDVEAGRMSLRTALSSLRRQLEPPGVTPGDVLFADRSIVRLQAGAFSTDVEDFLDRLRDSRAAADAAEPLIRAVALYRGELLPGYYDEWCLLERDRMAEHYASALRRLVTVLVSAGRHVEAVDYALRLIELDPLAEEPRASLIRLYIDTRRPALALRQFSDYSRLLQEELDQAPSDELQRLVESLGPGSEVTHSSHYEPQEPASSPISDAESAERALLADEPTRRAYIPLILNSFFGREREIDSILAVLAPDGGPPARSSRLVTLTGPGGSGKTRLALEIAHRVSSERGLLAGFVPLVEVSGSERIPAEIARALRITPSPGAEPADQVAGLLDQYPYSLLVLDTFEHLTEAGVGEVLSLLQRNPSLRLLITSRRKLGLPGEREIPLAPLPVPSGSDSPEELRRVASVLLFADRSQAVRPDFQLTPRNAETVAEICRRLDGLPLAIELAAARSLAIPPGQILERLSERFELLTNRRVEKSSRHRSLWAAIDWSFNLLSPELQRLFLKVSVFRGGCTAESAAGVCEEPRALDYLTQLRERSMLTVEAGENEMRFGMLESLREYARESQSADEIDQLADAHARWFVDFAEKAEPLIRGPEQAVWLARVDAEMDNLRAVMDLGLVEPRRTRDALRIAGAIAHYWFVRGTGREGERYTTALLEMPEAAQRDFHRGRALNAAGVMSMQPQDYVTAERYFRECLDIWREIDNQRGIAAVLSNLGDIARYQGRGTEARPLYEQALALNRTLGNRLYQSINLSNLGAVANQQGQYEDAERYFQESLAIALEDGLTQAIAFNNLYLGEVNASLGDWSRAEAHFHEALALCREMGNRAWEVNCLNGLGDCALGEGKPDAARELFQAGAASASETGETYNLAHSYIGLAAVSRLTGSPLTALRYLREAFQLGFESDSMGGSPTALEEAAQVVAPTDPRLAARLLGAAETERSSHEWKRQPAQVKKIEKLKEVMQAALAPQELDSLVAEGKTLEPREAIHLALSHLPQK